MELKTNLYKGWDEMSEIVSTKTVNTRKSHFCFGCAIEYPSKTEMNVVNCVDQGKIEAVYWCPTCQKIWERDMSLGDEIGYGDLRFGDKKYWEKVRDEIA